jgi:hypothetical protein
MRMAGRFGPASGWTCEPSVSNSITVPKSHSSQVMLSCKTVLATAGAIAGTLSRGYSPSLLGLTKGLRAAARW